MFYQPLPEPYKFLNFNFISAVAALKAANRCVSQAMERHGLAACQSLYSLALTESPIFSVETELMDHEYFGEEAPDKRSREALR